MRSFPFLTYEDLDCPRFSDEAGVGDDKGLEGEEELTAGGHDLLGEAGTGLRRQAAEVGLTAAGGEVEGRAVRHLRDAQRAVGRHGEAAVELLNGEVRGEEAVHGGEDGVIRASGAVGIEDRTDKPRTR